MLFLQDCLTTTRVDQNWKMSHPNSSRDELMCCASLSLSPSAWVFLSRSLPAKSHLSINLSIKSSVSCFSLAFCQLKIITLLCRCYKKAKIHIKSKNLPAFLSLFMEGISPGCYLSTETFLVLSEQSSRMKLRLLWQVQLIIRFQHLLNLNVWFFSQFQCLKLLQME